MLLLSAWCSTRHSRLGKNNLVSRVATLSQVGVCGDLPQVASVGSKVLANTGIPRIGDVMLCGQKWRAKGRGGEETREEERSKGQEEMRREERGKREERG